MTLLGDETLSTSVDIDLCERLMSGEGLASIFLYRHPDRPPVQSLAHGRVGNRLILAVNRQDVDDACGAALDAAPEVRLCIRAISCMREARIALADVHGLGVARLLDDAQSKVLASDLGDIFALAASHPGTALVEIDLSEVVVHGPTGTRRFRVAELEPAAVWDRLEAHERALCRGEELLARLADGVIDGTLPGFRAASRPCPPHSDYVERVLLVDADRDGVLLLDLRGDQQQTIYAAFESRADRPEQITDRIHRLVR